MKKRKKTVCINSKKNFEKQKEWLKDKPKTITAYKVVTLRDKKIYPPIFDEYGPYKKTNKISSSPRVDMFNYNGKYQAAFHLFLTKKGARNWYRIEFNQVILKCTIPKKEIVEVGRQFGYAAIITEEFTFVEGDNYFEKEI